jgi:hypothetical protein
MKTNSSFKTLFKNLLLSLTFFYSSQAMSQNTVVIGANNGVNGTFDYPCPIQDFYYATRAQYLYTAQELYAMGITPGAVVTEIGWIVSGTAIAGHLQENYSIFLLNTSVSSLSATWWEGGATQVYGPVNYSYPSGYAGNVMFMVSPFFYTGGNLLVEICGGLPAGSFTQNPSCEQTTGLLFNGSHQWRQDMATGCGVLDPTNSAIQTTRPVLVVTYTPGSFEGPSIEGNVYYDQNQNGVRDTGEIGVPNHFVNLSPVGYNSLTNGTGHYKFYCDTGSYAVSWIPSVPWTLTSTPAVYSISVPPDSHGNDFGIWAPAADVEYAQLVGYITGLMRCNRIGYSSLNILNTGVYSNNGITTLIHSANLLFDTAISTPGCSVTGDTVSWNYTNLLPGQNIYYSGNFHTGAAGDTVTFTYIDSVFDVSWNFQRVYSNAFTFVLTCSIDPNDKAVDPAGETAAHYTLMTEELMYTIRFQNTGNDTAFNIVVLDTLDGGLDISTLEVLANSHPVAVQTASGGALRFTFQNILLPDSNVDEPGSHGYVVYSVKPQGSLMDGAMVHNTAHIIFDMNAPVVTNTTYNTMVYSIPTGMHEIPWNGNGNIYPNPASGKAWICLNGRPGEKHWIAVYNPVGQKLLSTAFSGNQYLLPENLPGGIYMLDVRDEAGRLVFSSRFIKE